MSKFATEYPDGVLKDLDTLFKAGSGPGTTYFSQDGQDLAQRYAPLTVNKLSFNTGFIARGSNKDLTELFEARPPQADLQWSYLTGTGNAPTLPPHVAGDLIIVQANRSGSATAPTLASGFTNMAQQGSTNIAARVGYKVAASNAESGGTWTNAVSWLALVIKGGCLFIDAAQSTSQWPSNAMASPGKNIGLHMGFAYDVMTPPADDTTLTNALVGSYFCYAGYTGLVSSLPSGIINGGTYRIGFTFEMQPLQAYVPEMEANAAVLDEGGGTVTLPPHDAGDLIIVAAGWRDDAAPVIPAGSGLSLVIQSSGVQFVNGTIAAKVAASSSESAGTWGNDVTTLLGIVVKGCDGIGGKQWKWLNTSRIAYPAITMQKPAQSGILTIGFSNNQAAANGLPGPSSLQVLENLPNITQAARADGSYGLFTSWAEASLAAPSNVNLGFTLELFVTGAPKPVEGTITLGTNSEGYGYNNGVWIGGPCGAWTGNPSTLAGLLYWVTDDVTWMTFNGQYAGFNTITLSLDGSAPVTFTWLPGNAIYQAIGDPFGLTTKPKGVPYSLVSTAVTKAADTPIALSSEFPAPTPPADSNVRASSRINYGKIA